MSTNERVGCLEGRPLLLSLFVVASTVGCSQDEEDRFPPASECQNDCGGRRSVGGLATGSGGDTEATDTEEAPDGGDPSEPVDGIVLRGQVVVATSPDLATVADLSEGRAELLAINADGSTAETEIEAGEEFNLVVDELPVRVAVRSLDSELDLMPTVQWAARSPVELLLVERAVLEQIAENLTSNATFLNESRGHAFLEFRDGGNLPTSGVSVTASDAIVAYDIGVFYSDADQQTATRGTAVLLNAPAGDFPGSEQDVSYRANGQTTRIELPIAVDTVTIRIIQL